MKEHNSANCVQNVRVVVAQLGARMHYAVPRILQEAGVLERLYTDLCATGTGFDFLRSLPNAWEPGAVKRLLDRVPGCVPNDRITSYPLFGLAYVLSCQVALDQSVLTKTWLWGGATFAQRVARYLDFGKIDAVYAFQSAALEILQHARSAGVLAMLEQTNAPLHVVRKLLREEYERFPAWIGSGKRNDRFEVDYSQRESEEWRSADVIICGSDFVRKGIAECNGPDEKCLVVPYGVDSKFKVARGQDQPVDARLRVLTVGTVGLRKGTPYVLKAAKHCRSAATFRMVGSIDVPDKSVAELEKHVDVLGRVPRSEIHRQYEWADVFLLPSICEGSATVTYEALAAGLPVICTPNTGSIVRDGEEGFIVPIRDPESIATRIHQLAENPDLRYAMRENARVRYEQAGSLEAYAERLLKAISEDSGMLS